MTVSRMSRRVFRASILLAGTAIASPLFAGTVTGEVVDATNTRALEAAQVRIVELDRVAVAERDGRFRFADVPAGTYTIETRYIGAEMNTQTVEVPATGDVELSIAMGGLNARDIIVTGQSANQASALSRKRENDGISDVVTRDAIGQFPDQNVAESLRRLPGTNVLNDQGEGRFVSVRGLSPDLNATSLNGVRLPAPESDTRAVALDVVSSEIIESIEVKKSLTPDMDADTIGASVEIETTSAFDRRKDLLTVKLEGSYNDYADEVSPKGSVDFATRLGDNVGISGGVSYYKRKFETDNIEADDYSDAGGAIVPNTVEYRDYDVERERISATLGLDGRVSDTTEVYARGTYSQFDDQEYRRRTTFDLGDFEDDGPSAISGDTATFDSADQDFTVERDVKDRFESQKIRALTLGGNTETGPWRFDYSGSWAKSTETEDGSLDPVQFEQDFVGDGTDPDDNPLAVLFDYSDVRVPLYSVLNDPNGAFYDAAEYELNEIEFVDLSQSDDEEYALKFDGAREFYTGAGTFTVQAGTKLRWREKKYNKQVQFFENDAFTLADVLGDQTYRLIDIEPVANKGGSRDYFNDNFDDFELQEAASQFDSAVEDYRVDEDVKAGYLLGRFDNAQLTVIGGVRYEHTKNRQFGNDVTLFEEDAEIPGGGGATFDDDTVIVSPIALDKNYDHWLPSLNVRFEPVDNIVLRGAVYRSIVRPKLSDIAPRFAVEQNDDNEREGTFGNPDLQSTEAWNFDASAEYYMSSNGALTAAVFYKDLKNFIVEVNYDDPDVYRGIAYDEAVIPQNGDDARVFGVELGFAQSFSFLPSPFDGLIVQANYTYTDAKGDVALNAAEPAREVALQSTSKHTANMVLGYEKGPIELRLAGTYRDKYLDELNEEASLDRYVDDHFQLDLTAKLAVSDNIKLFYEWININNAKYFAYNNFGGQRNIYQYEEYNWTMKAGVRVNF